MKPILYASALLLSFSCWGQPIEDQVSDEARDTAACPCKIKPKYGCGSTQRGVTGFILSSDQDFLNLIGPNRDANYTMGAQLLWIGGGTNSRILGLPWVLAGIDQTLFGKTKRGLLSEKNGQQLDEFRPVFGFGVSAFTPENLELTVPDTTDRPYASTLFIKSGRVYGGATSPWMLETSFTLDVLGLHIAEFVQTAIHSGQRVTDTSARPNPLGWRTQVSDGFGLFGSYEAMAYAPWSYIFTGEAPDKPGWVTPYFGFGGSVGTYTRGQGVLGITLGKAPNTENQSIPNTFGLNIGRAERDGPVPAGEEELDQYDSEKLGKSRFSFFLDARIRGNVWGYNALLQGLPWEAESTYTLSGDEIERLTVLWDINANFIFRTTYLRIGFGGRSKEFKKSGAMPHGWGTIAMGWIIQ